MTLSPGVGTHVYPQSSTTVDVRSGSLTINESEVTSELQSHKSPSGSLDSTLGSCSRNSTS